MKTAQMVFGEAMLHGMKKEGDVYTIQITMSTKDQETNAIAGIFDLINSMTRKQ